MITNQEIISRLKSRKQYLNRMPGYSTGDFALFYSEIHDKYFQTHIGNNDFSYKDFKIITNDEIEDYLTFSQKSHYFRDWFFEDWEKVHINIQLLDDFVIKANKIIFDIIENPTHSFVCFYSEDHVFHLPVVGFYQLSEQVDFKHRNQVIYKSKAMEGILNVLLKNENVFSKEQADSATLKTLGFWSERLESIFSNTPETNQLFFSNNYKAFAFLSDNTPVFLDYKMDRKPGGNFNHPFLGEVDPSQYIEEHVDEILNPEGLKKQYRLRTITKTTTLIMNQYILDLAINFGELKTIEEMESQTSMPYQKVDLTTFLNNDYLVKSLSKSTIYIKYGYDSEMVYGIRTKKDLEESEVKDKANYYVDMLQHLDAYYQFVEYNLLVNILD